MKRLIPFFCAASLIGILAGCLERVEEVPLLGPSEELAAPQGLSATVASGAVTLTWRETAGAATYQVFRSADAPAPLQRLTEVSDTLYHDIDLLNGRIYYYTVAAVSEGGLEGERAAEIAAMPAAYAVLASGGARYTGARAVTLSLTAPAGTTLMRIGNSPDLGEVAWESFAATKNWMLEAGDGGKAVYAWFEDQSGARSSIVSDSIILDTYARVTDVVVPAARLAPGETAHFEVGADGDETGGSAWIVLGGFEDRITLSDDGRNGDPAAGDGRYEADFIFPTSVRGVEIVATGHFIDQAGNAAVPLEAANRLSFTDPPEAVRLLGLADSTVASVTIMWEQSDDEHFRSYRIYRSRQPGVTADPRYFIKELYNPAQTTFPDGGLQEGATYYYRLYVVNDLEETAPSNVLAAHTFDAYPTPVVLDEPSSIGTTRVTLTWSVNGNSDFTEYRIYRAMQPGVTSSSTLVATIAQREVVYYDDTGLNLPANTYYYRVYVYDSSGKNSRSNEVDTQP